MHDYSIELLKEENGRYTILEKLGDSRTKATQDYLAMKYTRGSKKEVTNSWTLEEVRTEIDQGKAVSSTRLLFITGYGINKETADKNADKKLEMFGEGAGQTITGTGRTLIGGKAVIVGLATCAETAGVGCGWAGIGLGNVTHGGNDAITGMQKVGHALSDSGYPIKGNVGAEYSRLKKGKGPSVSAENQYRIYNPGVSLIKAIGGTEDDYNVLNMYMGMALPYAAEYVENFSSRNTVKENKPERADSGNKKEINTELHQKINNREEGHYLNLQADKKVENITTSYKNFDHIAKGEVIVKGDKVKVTGGHSTRGGIIVEEKIQEFPGGAYEAKIKVPDPNNPGKYLEKTNNGGKSTMFPDNWTENRIKVEIDNVLKNPNNQVGDYKWQGTTSTGVKIEVIYREGKVITAYPIKP